jgi:FkbM family methyltransferase
MLASKKRLINQVLRPVGHIITREPCVPAWQIFFAVLGANSVMPQTVFDIGVAQGTPWLYGAFPDAFYYLMDPARESLPNMQRWAQSLHAEILDIALGASHDTEVIDVRDEISGSTLFREVGPYTSVARCDVPVRLFDAIIDDFKQPALCKIDVRGAELIASTAFRTEAAISVLSFLKRAQPRLLVVVPRSLI